MPTADGYDYAVGFRHASWGTEGPTEMLKHYNIAAVMTDSPPSENLQFLSDITANHHLLDFTEEIQLNRKPSGFPYFKFAEYLTCRAALAGIKVMKVFEDWTSQTVENVVKEEQERYKNCSNARIVEKRMLIEMLYSLLLTVLWDTFPK